MNSSTTDRFVELVRRDRERKIDEWEAANPEKALDKSVESRLSYLRQSIQ